MRNSEELPLGTIFKGDDSWRFLGSQTKNFLTDGYDYEVLCENIGQKIKTSGWDFSDELVADDTKSTDPEEASLSDKFFVVSGAAKSPEIIAVEVTKNDDGKTFSLKEDGLTIRFLHFNGGQTTPGISHSGINLSQEAMFSGINEGPEVIIPRGEAKMWGAVEDKPATEEVASLFKPRL